MPDHLTLEQLKKQRANYKRKLTVLVKKGISPEEFKKIDAYIRVLDKRIERSEANVKAGIKSKQVFEI